MHPLLVTMIANTQTRDIQAAADVRRRGRLGKPEPRRISFRRPRRSARAAAA